MGRLYPRMRERPAEWRLNPASPLASGLIFFGGGPGSDGRTYRDAGPFAWHGRLVGTPHSRLYPYVDFLSRFGLQMHRTSINYITFGTIPRQWLFLDSAFSASIWFFCTYPTGRNRMFECSNSMGAPWPGWTYEVRSASLYTWLGDLAYSRNEFGGSTTITANRWYHGALVFRRAAVAELYLNAKLDGSRDVSNMGDWTHQKQAILGNYDPGSYTQNFGGIIADPMLWQRALTPSEISALADPSNVDLRVGGVPLILPPRRRVWPVVSEQAIPKMVPWHLFQQVSA